jgi:myosin heavy subunit
MLVEWRAFTRSKRGAIRLQAVSRGRTIRKVTAAVKVQKYFRRFVAAKKYKILQCAILALQCRARERIAIRFLTELKKEQKDVGKLKENNQKLKDEMATLRAMLNAQAKESAAGAAHTKAIEEKEAIIAALEKRIAVLEKELAEAKKRAENMQFDLSRQGEELAHDKDELKHLKSHHRKKTPDSPLAQRRLSKHPMEKIVGVEEDYVSPAVLAEHMSRVATLEEELESERNLRRQVDSEVIKLRAAINGVKLNEDDVNALLAPQFGGESIARSEESSLADEMEDSPHKARYVFLRCSDGLIVSICSWNYIFLTIIFIFLGTNTCY